MAYLSRVYFSFVTLIVLCFSSHAQKTEICGEIEYQQVKRLANVLEENYLMKFNNEESYSEEIELVPTKDVITNEYSALGRSEMTTVGRNNLEPKFYYNSEKGFYFKDVFLEESLFVKEAANQWNWELLPETKEIGSFNVRKATITFRGRDYIAWYTEAIPVSFGPWKFHGLPGLILEVYDVDNLFHITAARITAGQDVACKIEAESFQLDKAMTIEKYLEKKDELVDDMFAQMSSQMPKGSKPLKRDKGCEDCDEKRLEIFTN